MGPGLTIILKAIREQALGQSRGIGRLRHAQDNSHCAGWKNAQAASSSFSRNGRSYYRTRNIIHLFRKREWQGQSRNCKGIDSTVLLDNADPSRQTQKDIPSQLLASTNPLSMSLIIASFGSSNPYKSRAFDLTIKQDPTAPAHAAEKPLRYMKQPEIHHIFKPDPKSPPKIISIFFTAVVLATLPTLLIVVS